MLVLPDPLNDRERFEEFTNATVCQTGVHTHCFTCMKGSKGALGCRMCKPSGDTKETMPVELVDITPVEGTSRKKVKVEFEVHEDISEEKQQNEEGTSDNDREDSSVISIPDNRLIVWEMKRPLMEMLPEYNKDDGIDKGGKCEWFITQLTEAMRSKAYKFLWPPPLLIDKDTVSLTNPEPDGNCLFATFLDFIEALDGGSDGWVNEI